jgi:molybdate transport system substrate-binding protein
VGLVLLIAGTIGCTGGQHAPERDGPALALVAASTRDAVQDLADGFTREGNPKVKVIAEDSSKLAQQIVNGAPAHLFLSANEKWADFIKEKGLVQDRVALLGNSLALIVPADSTAGTTGPEDLRKTGVKRIAIAGPTVPAGIYARQALKHLALWAELEKKAVFGEDVRATLAYVERGETDAGIVYTTDARISDRVRTVYTFPAAAHEPIRYPLLLLKTGGEPRAARRFYTYLQSPRAAEVFKKYGFTCLPTP